MSDQTQPTGDEMAKHALAPTPPPPTRRIQVDHDPVAHPSHYQARSGAELLDLIQHEPFGRASIMKYVFRAGKKHPELELEDLRKAQFLLEREIQHLQLKQEEENDGR